MEIPVLGHADMQHKFRSIVQQSNLKSWKFDYGIEFNREQVLEAGKKVCVHNYDLTHTRSRKYTPNTGTLLYKRSCTLPTLVCAYKVSFLISATDVVFVPFRALKRKSKREVERESYQRQAAGKEEGLMTKSVSNVYLYLSDA